MTTRTTPSPLEGMATVLLDMDGTLLDLAFDNYFWRELMPRCLARRQRLPLAAARERLLAQYAEREGTLDWYCLDYWSGALDVDLKALKAASSHRIRYLPGARAFLAAPLLRARRRFIVTNAHGHTFAVKRAIAGLDHCVDGCVSSHEIGHAKESPAFWPLLQRRLGFDPATTLLVDDNPAVLDAAAGFGVRVVAVRRPDSRGPERDSAPWPGVGGVLELLDGA